MPDRSASARRLRALTGAAEATSDGTGRAAGDEAPGDGWVPVALRVAADEYGRVHPDPGDDPTDPDGDPGAEPAPGGVRRPRETRRVRWAVSWRVAGMAAIAVALVVGAVALRAAALSPGAAVALPEPSPLGAAAPGVVVGAPASPQASLGVVVVHVVGAVAAPGVVRLPAGSRVVDAVAAAGGAIGDADLARLNLARILADGEQIVVPRPGEPLPATAHPVAGGGSSELVDLNAASLAQLDELPGVGPVLAQRIVDRRPFTSVDELDEVSGVGPTLLERLRPLVTV